MKKIIFAFILFSLCLSTAVSASVVVLNPVKGTSYNLGQELVITGHITLDAAVKSAQVDFKVVSASRGKSEKITTKFYTFPEDIPISFAQINQETLSWVIPDTTKAATDWKVVVEVSKEDEELKEGSSSAFSITDELSVTSSISSKLFNLGESLELSGTALDARSSPVEGTAILTLEEKKVGIVLTDTIPVSRGYLSYSYEFKSTDPKGDYTLSLSVKDDKGNNGLFGVGNITVTDTLLLTCNIDKEDYDAGDIIPFYGNLNDIHKEPMHNEPLTLWVSGPLENQSIQYTKRTNLYGEYEFKIELPKYTLPGSYEARVSVEDSAGNSGACSKLFSVIAETKLDVSFGVNSSWSYPSQAVVLTTRLDNKGNVDLSGALSYLLGSKEVLSKPFSVERGEVEIVEAEWNVTEDFGNKTLQVKAIKGATLLAESQSVAFEIVKPPKPKFKLTAAWLIVIGAILLAIVVVIYIYRKDIRDKLWHREFKKKIANEH